MSDKKDRFRELEEKIKAAAGPFVRRRKPKLPDKERRRKAQQRKRALKSGLLVVVKNPHFRIEMPAVFRCQHCDKEFHPKRTTAKFCCAKCRVYASRKPKPPDKPGH